jgi:regulator of sigma E protease
MLTLVSFIIVIAVIILVHEAGHFIAARLCGIRVETFSIGFGPRIRSFRWQGTEFILAWIPLGGYVKMAGIVDENFDGESSLTGAPDEFMSKTGLQKAFVICAGVMMNFLLALVLYTILFLGWGRQEPSPEPVVAGVYPEYPAAQAGLLAGDRLRSIDGVPVPDWNTMEQLIRTRAGQPMEVSIERQGTLLPPITLTPRAETDESGQAVGRVGIQQGLERVPVGLLEAPLLGLEQTGQVIRMAWDTLGSLISGRASLREVGGPIFIAQMSGTVARNGLVAFLGFIAFISVHIGFMNILPFPVLDGGHLVYILIESITGRALPTRVKLWINQAGVLLLLLLMVFIMKNDIQRLITGRTFGERPAAEQSAPEDSSGR